MKDIVEKIADSDRNPSDEVLDEFAQAAVKQADEDGPDYPTRPSRA